MSEEKLKRNSDKVVHYGMTKDGYTVGLKAKDVNHNLAHIRSILEEKSGRDVGVVNTVRSCIEAWWDIEGIDSPYPPPGANIDIKLLKKYQLYGVSIMSSWLCSKIHRGYGIKE